MNQDSPAAPLRVLFICGSVEPGRDGVGDHVRRLGGQLRAMGHQVAVAAIADPHVSGIKSETLVDHDDVVILRSSSYLTDDDQRDQVVTFVNHFAPEYTSLHFVPWSFDVRGVPRGLAGRLRPLTDPRPLHVMCHELWVFEPVGPRQRLLGLAQKRIILRELRLLAPAVVTTSIAFYRALLYRYGVRAEVISLFGNIEPQARSVVPSPTGSIGILVFGTPPVGRVRKASINGLGALAHERKLTVVVAGGHGPLRTEFAYALRRVLEPLGSDVEDAGFVSDARASALMMAADVGLVRNQAHYLGKSSTLLSMLEHGLAVWAPVWDGSAPDLTYRPHRVFHDLRAAAGAPRDTVDSHLPAVASSYVAMMSRL